MPVRDKRVSKKRKPRRGKSEAIRSITPHKGGRTAEYSGINVTPAERALIVEAVQISGMSAADMLVYAAKSVKAQNEAGETGEARNA